VAGRPGQRHCRHSRPAFHAFRRRRAAGQAGPLGQSRRAPWPSWPLPPASKHWRHRPQGQRRRESIFSHSAAMALRPRRGRPERDESADRAQLMSFAALELRRQRRRVGIVRSPTRRSQAVRQPPLPPPSAPASTAQMSVSASIFLPRLAQAWAPAQLHAPAGQRTWAAVMPSVLQGRPPPCRNLVRRDL